MQGILALPSLDLTWCDKNGKPLSFVRPTVPPRLVVSDPSLANLAQLRFRKLDSFQAGSLHNHVDFWENLISSTGYSCPKVSLLKIMREGVKVYDFFQHFKGNFEGRRYDSGVPLVSVFPNSTCCRLFCIFIESTILHWISQGVIKVHDMIGVCSPPHVVLPLTVEPTKPRLGHDECFLNLWTRDLPFKLDHLPDLPRYVLLGHFQTMFDDNNGYQHLKIHPDSQEFFRFSWRGYFSPFLDGKQVPFYITTLALLLPPLRVLWVYLYHSISMIDMWASYSHPTGLVTCLGDRNITSLLRYSRTPLRRPGEQFW